MEDGDMEDNKMVSVQYECETDISLELDCEALAKKVAQSVLELENCPYDSQVNLVLTDNSGIHEVNRQFRGIDAPTDVLSFPMIPFETPADYQILDQDESFFDLDTEELLLGDIVLCVQKIKEQADKYGHSEKRELAFLTAHSMMHLFGYDHMTPEESAVMEAKQNEVLERLGITR